MGDEIISYEFDSFRLIPAERQLLRDSQPVSLTPKAFDTLVILVQNNGHALKKEDLLKQVWPDSFVEESNLNHNVSVLRKALGHGNGYVETVRSYGFRFNADVRTIPEGSKVLIHKRTRKQVVFKEEETQSRRTTTIETKAPSHRMILAAALIVIVLAGGVGAAYFGWIRPARSGAERLVSTAPAGRRIKPTENPAAREAYLKGRFFWNKRNRDDIFKAQQFFQDALEKDPNYALAYVGLADCLMTGGSIPGSGETSKSFALKALAIDPDIAEAHATLAYYMSAVEWDWFGAETEFQKSISLNPSYATARHWHAYNLASLGRVEEAVSEIKKAEDADPLSAIIKTDVGHMLYFSRRYEEAIDQYLKALQLEPEFRVAHWRLGEAYIQVRRYDEAVSHLQKAISLEGVKFSGMEAWIAYAKAAANDRAGALQILNRLKNEAELRRWGYYVAIIYAALGDKDSAFAWLDKSLGYREGQLAVIKVEPVFDNLRDDPRFGHLLERLKLPG